ncbi:MAG TPA: hypothetical protein VFI06_07660 [Chitinophagaceae bacterium]|nr:hypothetical protein [Chitinophagaceae bacterium]
MLAEIKKLIQKDRKLQLILAGGLIIQLVTCVTATGFYHPDQHFSIIEFSSWQLGKESGVSYVWEFTHFVRPSLQIYLFSGYYKLCSFLTINDPYTQLTLLRILLGLAMFVLFNLLSIFYFKNQNPKILYSVLLILDFSWMLPYTRTLFCSEIVSSLFFFGALFLYEAKKHRPGWLYPALTGFLLGLAFFFRFQVGFCIAGFGLWLLFIEKQYRQIFPLVVGFLLATGLNVYMDSRFYGEWIFIPSEYFSANITQGRASQFGTSSFLRYISLLIAVITAPPFSLVLFYYGCKAIFKKYRQPVVLAVFLFIFFHCLVGHKEERFLFPIFNALPIVVGFGLPYLFDYYQKCKRWIAMLFRIALIITIVLNTAVLILFASIPYSQSVHFTSQLKNRFAGQPATIYYLYRSPYTTPGGSPYVFYKNGAENLQLQKITNIDTVRNLSSNGIFLAVTYNDLKEGRSVLDSLGYKPVIYSSKLLWNINEFLHSKKINTINDIWVLYKKD